MITIEGHTEFQVGRPQPAPLRMRATTKNALLHLIEDFNAGCKVEDPGNYLTVVGRHHPVAHYLAHGRTAYYGSDLDTADAEMAPLHIMAALHMLVLEYKAMAYGPQAMIYIRHCYHRGAVPMVEEVLGKRLLDKHSGKALEILDKEVKHIEKHAPKYF